MKRKLAQPTLTVDPYIATTRLVVPWPEAAVLAPRTQLAQPILLPSGVMLPLVDVTIQYAQRPPSAPLPTSMMLAHAVSVQHRSVLKVANALVEFAKRMPAQRLLLPALAVQMVTLR